MFPSRGQVIVDGVPHFSLYFCNSQKYTVDSKGFLELEAPTILFKIMQTISKNYGRAPFTISQSSEVYQSDNSHRGTIFSDLCKSPYTCTRV